MHPQNELFGWLGRQEYKYEWFLPTHPEKRIAIGYDIKINDEVISEKITFETNDDEAPLEEITVDEPCSIEELFQSSHSEYINDKEK